jgi:hypothetical protein
LVGLNHFTVPRAIVDLPTEDSGDFILIGGFAANTATQLYMQLSCAHLDFGARKVGSIE